MYSSNIVPYEVIVKEFYLLIGSDFKITNVCRGLLKWIEIVVFLFSLTIISHGLMGELSYDVPHFGKKIIVLCSAHNVGIGIGVGDLMKRTRQIDHSVGDPAATTDSRDHADDDTITNVLNRDYSASCVGITVTTRIMKEVLSSCLEHCENSG